MLLVTQSLTLGMLYVIDTAPQQDIEHTRERFLRRPGPPRSRENEMEQAELAGARRKSLARFCVNNLEQLGVFD